MSSTITGSDTYPANITIPSDGDVRNAASVNGAFEDLADRTTYAKARLDEGVSIVRHYADVAALRAETVHTDGSFAALNGGGTGAVFIYDASSTRADDSALCIKPTDVGGGAGRWLNPAVKLLTNAATFTATMGFSQDIAASSNINCTGTINAGVDVFASGDVTASGTCYSAGISCSGAATITGGLTVSGGSGLQVTGGVATTLSGTLGVTGACTFTSSVTVTGGTTCSGTLGVAGTATFGNPVVFSGTAAIKHRKVIGADATPTTYGIADAEHVFVKTLTGNQTYTLSNTSAQDGMRMLFTNISSVYTITIDAPEEAGIAVIGGPSSSQPRGAMVVFSGGRWERAMLVAAPHVGGEDVVAQSDERRRWLARADERIRLLGRAGRRNVECLRLARWRRQDARPIDATEVVGAAWRRRAISSLVGARLGPSLASLPASRRAPCPTRSATSPRAPTGTAEARAGLIPGAVGVAGLSSGCRSAGADAGLCRAWRADLGGSGVVRRAGA